MPRDYLHIHPRFADLVPIVADDRRIVPAPETAAGAGVTGDIGRLQEQPFTRV